MAKQLCELLRIAETTRNWTDEHFRDIYAIGMIHEREVLKLTPVGLREALCLIFYRIFMLNDTSLTVFNALYLGKRLDEQQNWPQDLTRFKKKEEAARLSKPVKKARKPICMPRSPLPRDDEEEETGPVMHERVEIYEGEGIWADNLGIFYFLVRSNFCYFRVLRHFENCSKLFVR